jgi:hypothetical protein
MGYAQLLLHILTDTLLQMGFYNASLLEDTRYHRMWPIKFVDNDGHELIIGTKAFNILIMSNLRLNAQSVDAEEVYP